MPAARAVRKLGQKKWAAIASCILFLAAAPIFAAPGTYTAREKKSAGWAVDYDSRICGKVTAYITDSAVKLVDKKASTTLVSTGPSWQVAVFNASSKTIFSCPLKNFQGFNKNGFQLGVGFYFPPMPLVKLKDTATVSGRKATVYGTSAQVEQRLNAQFQRQGLDGGAPARAKLLASSDWHAAPQLACVLCRLLGMADVPDVPLEYHVFDHDGSDKQGLKTLSIKQTTIGENFFTVPTGYRQVSTMEDVRLDQDGRGAIEDMVSGFDRNLERPKPAR